MSGGYITNEMRWRTLILYGAVVFDEGEWRPLSSFRIVARRTATNLLTAARKAGIMCKCACGCGIWAMYADLDFDHAIAKINGGTTEIRMLQPLRRDPCHRSKTRIDVAIRDKIRRIRQKFFGEGPPKPKRRWGYRPLPSRPMRGWRPAVIEGGRA